MKNIALCVILMCLCVGKLTLGEGDKSKIQEDKSCLKSLDKKQELRCIIKQSGEVNKDTNSEITEIPLRIAKIFHRNIEECRKTFNNIAIERLAKETNQTNVPRGKLNRSSQYDKQIPITLKEGNDGKTETEYISGISAHQRKSSNLQFLDVPEGNAMHIHELKLEEENVVMFEVFSALIGYFQPYQFPLDLVKNLSSTNSVSYQYFVTQMLKYEMFIIIWVALWAFIVFSLPCLIIPYICNSGNIRRLNENSSESSQATESCTEHSLGISLHLVLILMVFPIVTLLAGNEQISKSLSKSSLFIQTVYGDIENFIQNSHMQITFITTSSMDITIEAVRKDLQDVEELLGQPYKNDLTFETGVDVALENLQELKLSTSKVTFLVFTLLSECQESKLLSQNIQENLEEMARTVILIRQQCLFRDRIICYTLQTNGLDVTFSTESLTSDSKLEHLDKIGKEVAFNESIENAQGVFCEIPSQVAIETAPYIADIKDILNIKRTEVYKANHQFDNLAKNLSQSLRNSQLIVENETQNVTFHELWLWISILGICSFLFITWGLLLCGAPCGCNVTSRTIPFLIAGISLSFVMIIVLWVLGSIALIIGAHLTSLLENALYSERNFATLGKLFDSNGLFYGNDGIFGDLNRGNGSIKIETVLRDCQRSQPVYKTFNLSNTLDIKTALNYQNWHDLQKSFEKFKLRHDNLELLSPSLQLNLQVLSSLTTVNLTEHRVKISGPTTRRDLNSFIDQLGTVSRQIGDIRTSEKINMLAFNVRKLVQGDIKKLENIRDRILYKLTTLDVLLQPLNKLANHSLSHLKTIQYFLDHQGQKIAKRNIKIFLNRLEIYLKLLHDHVNKKLTQDCGNCRILWDVFHSTRFLLCKLLIDPINATFFASFLFIILVLFVIPIVIKLINLYRDGDYTSTTHRRASNGSIDTNVPWATPSSRRGTVEDLAVVSRRDETRHQERNISTNTAWVTPPSPRHQSNLSRIPPPSDALPSTSRSRVATASKRFFSSTRTKGQRGRDSLRLIDPSAWKNGNVSAGNWI